MKKIILILTTLFICQGAFAQSAVKEALQSYSNHGRLKFDADRGRALWTRNHPAKNGKDRRCSLCHGEDLTKNGEHARSGKLIKPMAPSVNPARFTKLKKINKWFKRNCKWTWGRECTNQEKGDILTYLSQQ